MSKMLRTRFVLLLLLFRRNCSGNYTAESEQKPSGAHQSTREY